MSYYAKIKGDIVLNCKKATVSPNNFKAMYPGKESGVISFSYFIEDDKTTIRYSIDDYCNYDEDEFETLFQNIAPDTVSGLLIFTGEDDEIWKYEFKNGRWEETSGKLSFPQQYAITFVYPDSVVSYLDDVSFEDAIAFVRDNLSLANEESLNAGFPATIAETVVANEYAAFKFNGEETILVYVSKVYS